MTKKRKKIQISKNPNHPKPGQNITVEPIRCEDDIKAIMKLLSDNPRNYLLFTMGVNNGLRTGDLLKLHVRDVRYLKPGDTLKLRESKTKKENYLACNKLVHKAIQNYLEKVDPEDEDFLFKSTKGNRALTIQAVNALIKKWARAINLKGNYGAHSLRKTWGYQQRTKYGVGFEIIADRFKHSSPAITMRYLGIEKKEVIDVLTNNEIGG